MAILSYVLHAEKGILGHIILCLHMSRRCQAEIVI